MKKNILALLFILAGYNSSVLAQQQQPLQTLLLNKITQLKKDNAPDETLIKACLQEISSVEASEGEASLSPETIEKVLWLTAGATVTLVAIALLTHKPCAHRHHHDGCSCVHSHHGNHDAH